MVVQSTQWSSATLAFACGYSTVTLLLEISDQTMTLPLTLRHGACPLPTSLALTATLVLTSRTNQSLQTSTSAAPGQTVSTRANSSVLESARTLSQQMPQLSRKLTGNLRASESTQRTSKVVFQSNFADSYLYVDTIPSIIDDYSAFGKADRLCWLDNSGPVHVHRVS